jgi:hypothetical protein
MERVRLTRAILALALPGQTRGSGESMTYLVVPKAAGRDRRIGVNCCRSCELAER